MYSPSDRSYPKLKGRAAENRHLTPALLHVWETYMSNDNRQHREVRLGLKLSWQLEEILNANADEAVLPTAAADEFERTTFDFLAIYTSLANFHMDGGSMLFNITIKSHYLLHCGLQARYLNPRLSWCYAGEDMMSKMKDLCSTCLRGNAARQATVKALAKYIYALHLMMTSRR